MVYIFVLLYLAGSFAVLSAIGASCAQAVASQGFGGSFARPSLERGGVLARLIAQEAKYRKVGLS
jgi:hypothetical protein